MSQAIDLFFLAKECKDNPKKPSNWIKVHHNSASSIIHSFSALESFINEVGYQMLVEKKSHLFIDQTKINYALKKIISNWKNTSCIDKLNILIEQLLQISIPSKLTAELAELNNLRNWLVHGFVFRRTVLLELKDEEENAATYDVIDMEDDVDWHNKFPNTKFNSIDNLDGTDAKKALLIVLSAIILLNKARKEPFIFASYFYGPNHYIINNDTSENADAVLSRIENTSC